MDTTDPSIRFDENGVCNHCRDFLVLRQHFQKSESKRKELDQLVVEIKEQRRHGKYDCIIGVSGGIDSTYVAYVIKELGLRPLAVHVDNGWNSELAVRNIEKVLKTLDIDLYTHVIDWEEFRHLQISFLKASVTDAEIPTDHAIRAVLLRVAIREGVKYIINGRNLSTEGILPWSWTYSALDWKYIHSVHERFWPTRLSKYPYTSILYLMYSVLVKRIKSISILNYVDYHKKEAMDILKSKLAWVDYGGKHYESIYTRFFQAYILPLKFDIDKRKAHFSVLVCTDQMTREEALAEMKKPPFPDDRLAEDRQYVLKKLRLSEEQFQEIMSQPIKRYSDYPNHSTFFLFHKNKCLYQSLKLMKRLGIVPRGFADQATAS